MAQKEIIKMRLAISLAMLFMGISMFIYLTLKVFGIV